MVGEIAARHISPATRDYVKKLLGDESLAHAGTWADFIKSDSRWDYINSWHYVNVSRGRDYDQVGKSKSGDVIRAIIAMEDLLRNSKVEFEKRQTALKLLIHFIGDIHQPLHNGYAADQGANLVEVSWFELSSNLHMVWDEKLIELQKMSYSEYATFLDHASADEIKKWNDSSVLDWHKESREMLEDIYQINRGLHWEYRYNYVHIKNLNRRLLQAGIRLAQMLDNLASMAPLSGKMVKMRKKISQDELKALRLL